MAPLSLDRHGLAHPRRRRRQQFRTGPRHAGHGDWDQPDDGKRREHAGDERLVDGDICFSRVKLIGSYARANASADASEVEADAGTFVSFQLAHFFSGVQETINSNAHTDYWRGSARAEINILPNVDLTGGWTERSRTLDGSALISSIYLDAVTYAGVLCRRPAQDDQRYDLHGPNG